MRAETAGVVGAMNELTAAVTAMVENVNAMEVSLRDLRHEVERREDLIDQTADQGPCRGAHVEGVAQSAIAG